VVVVTDWADAAAGTASTAAVIARTANVERAILIFIVN
jgi:hypothetical protein